jgi:hypothetical protein
LAIFVEELEAKATRDQQAGREKAERARETWPQRGPKCGGHLRWVAVTAGDKRVRTGVWVQCEGHLP